MPRRPAPAESDDQPEDGLPAGAQAPPTGFSQSLERGLTILSSFDEARPVQGIADLARAVGLNKSTTYRYVETLAKLGYVQQDPGTKKYSLGPRVVDLGFAAINSMEITRVAGYHLQALSNETGYTVSMAVLDGPDIVYVDRRRSGRASSFAMGLHLHVGSRLPAYCTSMGQVLLSQLPADTLDAYLGRVQLIARTASTTTTTAKLRKRLKAVREADHALLDQELEVGLRSIAVPVRDARGTVIAAMNVSTHASQVALDEMQQRFLPVLLQGARSLSTVLLG